MSFSTYVIQAVSGGPIKIGRTASDPKKRLRELQTGSPEPLRIVHVFDGDHERELHDRLSAYRLHGEWFRPDALPLIDLRTCPECKEWFQIPPGARHLLMLCAPCDLAQESKLGPRKPPVLDHAEAA